MPTMKIYEAIVSQNKHHLKNHPSMRKVGPDVEYQVDQMHLQ